MILQDVCSKSAIDSTLPRREMSQKDSPHAPAESRLGHLRLYARQHFQVIGPTVRAFSEADLPSAVKNGQDAHRLRIIEAVGEIWTRRDAAEKRNTRARIAACRGWREAAAGYKTKAMSEDLGEIVMRVPTGCARFAAGF